MPRMDEENELVALRRKKLDALRAQGVEPFGVAFEPDGTIAEVREKFAEGEILRAAGRITAHRDMGKSHFLDLRDSTGRIQVYIHAKEVGADLIDLFRLLDIGDLIGTEGTCFLTKSGEPTLKARTFRLMAKALRPLPEKWHGLQDIEARYRQRYLDLLTNERSRVVFEKRIAIVRETRRFFEEHGFLEVETPILQTVAGGAAAEPFSTHHKALGLDLYLRIAPELYLKRLLVGGFNKVFEINRNFRNEGISRKHNPEFTMLEAYWAYADFEKMANLVTTRARYEQTRRGNFAATRRFRSYTACLRKTHRRADNRSAFRSEDNSLVDVFELIINGTEIAPGYSELNDPLAQRQRLLEQAGEETQKIDEEFLLALEHGMPPAGGFGMGMDRLTMLLTGAESIRDVILFPLLRPKK